MRKTIVAFLSLLTLFVSCKKDNGNDNDNNNEPKEPYLEVDKVSLLLPMGSGRTDTFNILSNVQWKVSMQPTNADWLSASITTGTGKTTIIITSTQTNTSDTVKKATILISPVNAPDIKPVWLTVWQTKSTSVRNVYGGTGNENFMSIVATADGGLIAVGTADSKNGDVNSQQGSNDVWIVKLDANNNIVWQKTFGSSTYDGGVYIHPATDGNYLVLANGGTDKDFAGSPASTTTIFKIDGTGNILQKKNYGATFWDVVDTKDGGYLFAGYVDYNHSSVTKTNSDLEKVWQKGYDDSVSINFTTLKPASDGGYILGGGKNTTTIDNNKQKGKVDACLIKIDENGNKIWEKLFGGTGTEHFLNMTTAADGGYVMVGNSNSIDGDLSGQSTITPANGMHGWIIKVDANGNKVWSKVPLGHESNQFYWVTSVAGGGYLATGQTSYDGFLSNIFEFTEACLIKMEENGNIAWQRNAGGDYDDMPLQVLQTPKGDFVMAGESNSQSRDIKGYKGGKDAWIIKF